MNERGVVGSQERVGGRHLLGLAGPAERDPLARVLPLELVPADTGGNGRVQWLSSPPSQRRSAGGPGMLRDSFRYTEWTSVRWG